MSVAILLHPRFSHFHVSDLSVVSNDGIPSAVYYTDPVKTSSPKGEEAVLWDPPHRVRRSSSIGGLSDSALDLFPPSPEDLAELEEVERYVEMLAYLEFCEETHGRYPQFNQLKRRWSERRKEPAVPRPASGRHVKVHHSSGSSSLNIKEVVRGLHLPTKSTYCRSRADFGKGERKRRTGKSFASKNRVYQPMK